VWRKSRQLRLGKRLRRKNWFGCCGDPLEPRRVGEKLLGIIALHVDASSGIALFVSGCCLYTAEV
jgi:hypothetical protein